jgi:predicted metal-dependent hydrolase
MLATVSNHATVPASGVLYVDDLDIHVQVSDQRRTVRLTVERDGSITAVVPPGLDRLALDKAVKAKRRWLYEKLAEREALGEWRSPRQFLSGEGFPYLGRSYRLLVVDEGTTPVRLRRGRLELRRDCVEDAARQLVRWYRRTGHPWLRRRVEPWADRMDVRVIDLRVLPLGYRWGSCRPDGRVNIHWAAMQLPPDLVDYVLAHELAHLIRPDHSTEFWRLLGRAMPDLQIRRERLRRLGPDLWLPEHSSSPKVGNHNIASGSQTS